MALGGGTWTTQNKVLPGAYINFVSADRAGQLLSDRGVCAVPMELDWGKDGGVITLEAEDVRKETLRILGYEYTDKALTPLREVFRNAKTLYIYRLNSGEKAANAYATANCSGIRGNDLKIVIAANVDETSKFDVSTYIGTSLVDTQTVEKAGDLAANEFVTFKSDAVLEETAGTPLSGGTNGDVTGDSHQKALDALESYMFNILCCASSDDKVKALYVAYTKRLRDEVGAKFQTVIYNSAADYIGVINLKSKVTGADEQNLVYWLAGAEAGCAVNRSITNAKYDGEYIVDTPLTQDQLKAAIKRGELVFHKVGNEIHVLTDINSYVTVTKEMNEDFQLNQVIRVLDQVGNDIASVFNSKYLGKIQNNDSGRVSFWNDVVTFFTKLQDIGAIENFSSEEVTVESGTDKRSVLVNTSCQPVCAMEKLYMTVTVE